MEERNLENIKYQNSKIFLLSSLLILAVLIPEIISAQEFTYKKAIEYALEHNPSITIAKNRIKKAEVILEGARRRLDLNINVQLGYEPLSDRRGIGFSISQDLDRLLGGNKKEKDLAKLDLDSAQQEFYLIQQQIVREVTEAFINLERIKGFLRLKEDTYLDCKKSLDLAREKFELGIISLDELLTRQSKLRDAEFEFGQAERETKQAYLKFYQVIAYSR